MAKNNIQYKVKNIDSVFNAVKEIYKDLTSQKDELDKIGQFVKDRIVSEARKGNDLTNEGAKQPELSEGYIGYRRRLGQKAKAADRIGQDKGTKKDFERVSTIGIQTPIPDGTFFRPSKSNLTLTGQLLNSIEYTVDAGKHSIKVEPTGVRNDGKTNKEVAQELATRKTRLAPNGRKFLGLDTRGFERIRNRIVEAIRRIALKKGL